MKFGYYGTQSLPVKSLNEGLQSEFKIIFL